jgi:hypothetical protein
MLPPSGQCDAGHAPRTAPGKICPKRHNLPHPAVFVGRRNTCFYGVFRSARHLLDTSQDDLAPRDPRPPGVVR